MALILISRGSEEFDSQKPFYFSGILISKADGGKSLKVDVIKGFKKTKRLDIYLPKDGKIEFFLSKSDRVNLCDGASSNPVDQRLWLPVPYLVASAGSDESREAWIQ